MLPTFALWIVYSSGYSSGYRAGRERSESRPMPTLVETPPLPVVTADRSVRSTRAPASPRRVAVPNRAPRSPEFSSVLSTPELFKKISHTANCGCGQH